MTVITKGECLKIKGAICSVSINADDICKVLPRCMGNNDCPSMSQKKKHIFKSHVLFEAVTQTVVQWCSWFLEKKLPAIS